MRVESSLVEELVIEQGSGVEDVLEFGKSPKLGDAHGEESIQPGVEVNLLAVLQVKLPGNGIVIISEISIVVAQVKANAYVQRPKPVALVIKAVLGEDARQANEIFRGLLQGNGVVEVEIPDAKILL